MHSLGLVNSRGRLLALVSQALFFDISGVPGLPAPRSVVPVCCTCPKPSEVDTSPRLSGLENRRHRACSCAIPLCENRSDAGWKRRGTMLPPRCAGKSSPSVRAEGGLGQRAGRLRGCVICLSEARKVQMLLRYPLLLFHKGILSGSGARDMHPNPDPVVC